jgi:hypothetical protein
MGYRLHLKESCLAALHRLDIWVTLLIDLDNRVAKLQEHMREERLHPVAKFAVTNAGTQRVKYRLDIEAIPIVAQV